MPAKAVCQPTKMLNVPASSSERRPEQAHTQRSVVVPRPGFTTAHCRSWLASESGMSADKNAECTDLFADKPPGASPLPQGSSVVPRSGFTPAHCGSWLASESGMSANINAECTGLFARRAVLPRLNRPGQYSAHPARTTPPGHGFPRADQSASRPCPRKS